MRNLRGPLAAVFDEGMHSAALPPYSTANGLCIYRPRCKTAGKEDDADSDFAHRAKVMRVGFEFKTTCRDALLFLFLLPASETAGSSILFFIANILQHV